MAAASATVAVEVGATACACESPCTTRQGGFKSERGMRTALDGMEGSASSMGERIPIDDHAEEEEPEGKTTRGIEPLGASNIVRGWDTSQGLGMLVCVPPAGALDRHRQCCGRVPPTNRKRAVLAAHWARQERSLPPRRWSLGGPGDLRLHRRVVNDSIDDIERRIAPHDRRRHRPAT